MILVEATQLLGRIILSTSFAFQLLNIRTSDLGTTPRHCIKNFQKPYPFTHFLTPCGAILVSLCLSSLS
jgi:hypothetical protein